MAGLVLYLNTDLAAWAKAQSTDVLGRVLLELSEDLVRSRGLSPASVAAKILADEIGSRTGEGVPL
jgi:hypothetical protein